MLSDSGYLINTIQEYQVAAWSCRVTFPPPATLCSGDDHPHFLVVLYTELQLGVSSSARNCIQWTNYQCLISSEDDNLIGPIYPSKETVHLTVHCRWIIDMKMDIMDVYYSNPIHSFSSISCTPFHPPPLIVCASSNKLTIIRKVQGKLLLIFPLHSSPCSSVCIVMTCSLLEPLSSILCPIQWMRWVAEQLDGTLRCLLFV